MCKYKKQEKVIHVFADMTSPRYLTSTCIVDYETMAGGDKFGNLVISRLPDDQSKQASDDPTGSLKVRDGFFKVGAPYKVGSQHNTHVRTHSHTHARTHTRIVSHRIDLGNVL